MEVATVAVNLVRRLSRLFQITISLEDKGCGDLIHKRTKSRGIYVRSSDLRQYQCQMEELELPRCTVHLSETPLNL